MKLVSCSTPTGPRAWILPVAMPISRAEAELAAVGELGRGVVQQDRGVDLVEETCGALSASSATIASVWCEPWFSIWAIASSTPSTTFAEMIASRYSVSQSSSVAGFTLRINALHGGVAAHLAAGVDQHRRSAASGASPRTARSTSSVSAAPQTPVRRILALSTIDFAMSSSAERVDIDVADAFEMREHRHARLGLHARDQALAAARHDHVDAAVQAGQHLADRGAVARRHQLDRILRQAGFAQALHQAVMDGAAGAETSEPPRRITALPAFRQSAPASAVTLGRLSKITPMTPSGARTRSMFMPFGRCQLSVTAPTGSAIPRTVATPSAMPRCAPASASGGR